MTYAHSSRSNRSHCDHYELYIKELSESAMMGQRFIRLIKLWVIDKGHLKKLESLFVQVPTTVLWRYFDARPLVLSSAAQMKTRPSH